MEEINRGIPKEWIMKEVPSLRPYDSGETELIRVRKPSQERTGAVLQEGQPAWIPPTEGELTA